MKINNYVYPHPPLPRPNPPCPAADAARRERGEKRFSARAAATTLQYFHDDYEPIGNAVPVWQDFSDAPDSYNGNISCIFVGSDFEEFREFRENAPFVFPEVIIKNK